MGQASAVGRVQFNLNDPVKLKLTKEGVAIFTEHVLGVYRGGVSSQLPTYVKDEMARIDSDGFIEMQMWQAMSIFGEYVHNGNPKPPFCMDVELFPKKLTEGKQ